MTLKDIEKIACDEDCMLLLSHISDEHSNLCYKSVYEKKAAKKRIRSWCTEIEGILTSE